MEQRKLIKLGNSSFAIALPKPWIEKSGLKKGDNIFIEHNSSGELNISSKFKKLNGEKESTIQIEGKSEGDIKRKFTSAYIGGSSMINFNGTITKERSRIIKDMIKEYIGCEVVEEGEKNIKVKDFFNFEEANLVNFMKRIDNNIREMFNFLIEAIKEGKTSRKGVEEIKKIDADINKFYFLNSRIFMSGLNNPSLTNTLGADSLELFNLWWITFHLEHTGDDLKSIYERMNMIEISQAHQSSLVPLLEKLKIKYEESLKAFYNKDLARSHQLMEEGKEILRICESLSQSQDAFTSMMGEKLKEVNNSSYQIVKMVSNMGDENVRK